MRAAAPPLGSPRRPVRRLAVPGPGSGLGLGAGKGKGKGRRPARARGRGLRCGGPRLPARGLAAARLRRRARHVAPPCARAPPARPQRKVPLRARGRSPRPVPPPVRAGDWGVLPPEVAPGWPYAGTRRSPTRRLRAPGRWSAGPEVKGGNFRLSLDRRSATSCSSQCHLAGRQPSRSSLASR